MAKKRYSDKEIRETLFYLRDYHKWWLIRGILRNPKADNLTKAVLNLKDETHSKHGRAVKLFSGLLEEFLEDVINEDEEIYAAYVPSHEAGKKSAGLGSVLTNVSKSYNIANSKNLLYRHKTVPKLSHGGNREKDVHLNSIRVFKNAIPKGAKVLLIDDVTTSSNSLLACEELLYASGAGLVISVALTKTADDD